jgi:hypothetical protein
MNIENAFIVGFLLHFVGDYLFQNDWMATEKTKNSGVALAHASIYSIPFYLLVPSYWWLLIFVTHFLFDRYRLAQYWIRLVNWRWDGDNFGFADDKPKWMSVWLMIIVDNTFHVIFNSAAIYFSFTL